MGRLRALGDHQLHLTRRAVDQRVELDDFGSTEAVNQALDHAAVHLADQLGVGFGQLAERAPGEGHYGAVVDFGNLRVEAEPGLLRHQRTKGIGALRPLPGIGLALVSPGISQIARIQPAYGGGLEDESGQHGKRRGLQTQRRRIGGQRVEVLRSTDAAPLLSPHLEQPHLPHPLEMGPDGVDVKAKHIGDFGCGQGNWRAGQLQIDRIAGVVTEGLEDVQPRWNVHNARLHGEPR